MLLMTMRRIIFHVTTCIILLTDVCDSRKTDLQITNDPRSAFLVEPFCFDDSGKLDADFPIYPDDDVYPEKELNQAERELKKALRSKILNPVAYDKLLSEARRRYVSDMSDQRISENSRLYAMLTA